MKSPPELWEELQGDCLSEAIGELKVRQTKPDEELSWHADGVRGFARIKPSNWGTKVILTAEVEEQVATLGLWERMRGLRPPPSPHDDIEQRLEGVLDNLGSAHRKPFQRD